jgi:proteasome lid subunit RPN8/RPN11
VDNLKTTIFIHTALWQQILENIWRVVPEEGCGFVAGTGLESCVVLPVTNQLHSPVRFIMAPLEQLKAMLWIEENGMDTVAIYHSHPKGPAVPSPTDLAEFAYPDAICLIVSPLTAGQIWHIRGFRIIDAQYEELSITLGV